VSGSVPEVALEDELRELVRRQRGSEVDRIERLRGGLGHRAFFRLWLRGGGPATLVARVDRGAPAPGVLPEPPLEPIRAFLERHGLPVPQRLGGDPAAGIDLLEDVGSESLADAAPGLDEATRRALYEEACDLVPRLQALREPASGLVAFARRLDLELLRLKARRFAAAGLPAALGRAATAAEAAVARAAFDAVGEAIADAPFRLAHRDFQGANLLLRPAAPPGARLALVDLQGAWLAPPEYDLVCLLRDSYVELPDVLVHALAERVRPRLPDAPTPDTFWSRFHLLTVARKAKDLALFHEVAARGDASWLRFAPASLRYVRAAARRVAGLDPSLARLAELLAGSRAEDAACAR
jgi:hypothetical protein